MLMLIACLISGEFTLKHSNGIILSAVNVALLSSLYTKRVNYFAKASMLFIIAASVFGVKLILGNIIVLSSVKNYFNFAIALINMSLLLPALFKNVYLHVGLRFLMLWVSLLPSMIIITYYCITGTWFAADTLLAILQTNAQEMIEYIHDNLSWKAVFCLLTLNIALFFLSTKIEKIKIDNKQKLCVVICCIILSLVGVYKYRGNLITDIPKQASKILQQYKAFSEARIARKENMNKFVFSTNTNDGIYVLVIGESQNKAHMSAYGYNRATTPWLNRMIGKNNMLLFSRAYSCHTHTVPTLLYALTAKNQYNSLQVKNSVSLLEVAKAAGYETVWLSNQVKFGAWDTPITSIASEANQQKWINSNVGETTATNYFDGKLVEEFDKIKITPKMLIIIHLMGNHGSYEQRYPKDFSKFTGKNTIDKYDNSIVYNDYVMSKLFDKVSKLPNFKGLIYCSDHADAVDKNLSHDSSQFDFDMTHIPLYMYLSDSYIQDNPKKYSRLQQQEDNVFTNDLLFNMLLGLMDIQLRDIYEPTNDITTTSFDNNLERFTTLYGKKHITEDSSL